MIDYKKKYHKYKFKYLNAKKLMYGGSSWLPFWPFGNDDQTNNRDHFDSGIGEQGNATQVFNESDDAFGPYSLEELKMHTRRMRILSGEDLEMVNYIDDQYIRNNAEEIIKYLKNLKEERLDEYLTEAVGLEALAAKRLFQPHRRDVDEYILRYAELLARNYQFLPQEYAHPVEVNLTKTQHLNLIDYNEEEKFNEEETFNEEEKFNKLLEGDLQKIDSENDQINIELTYGDQNVAEITVNPFSDVHETISNYLQEKHQILHNQQISINFGGQLIEEGNFDNNGIEDGAYISVHIENTFNLNIYLIVGLRNKMPKRYRIKLMNIPKNTIIDQNTFLNIAGWPQPYSAVYEPEDFYIINKTIYENGGDFGMPMYFRGYPVAGGRGLSEIFIVGENLGDLYLGDLYLGQREKLIYNHYMQEGMELEDPEEIILYYPEE